MAEDLHAIADLIGDAYDLAPIEVSDLLRASPLIAALGMQPASNGVVHKYVKETGAPVVGFRAVNVGREQDSSDDTAVSIDLKILDASFTVDVAVANAWRKGREAYLAREAKRHLAAALFAFEKQVINGVIGASDSAAASGSAGGFAGFRDAATVDALADAMVVTAGAGTADLNSSVWAVRLAEDGITGVYRSDGDPFEMMETTVIQRLSSAALYYPAYYTPHTTWLGLQLGSAFDLARIANVSVAVPLTDDMIAELLSKAPVGSEFTHILMGRRSRKQLQDSRTATNSTGTPAPFPTESFGVPIITTDAITATEELIA
jgi:hypothetical protein